MSGSPVALCTLYVCLAFGKTINSINVKIHLSFAITQTFPADS